MVPAPSPIARAVITGASGFVGSALAARLPASIALSFGALDWREALARTDLRGATVFHLAARVHEREATPSAFEEDNVAKTLQLARAAAAAGAARFVFASTVKVFGEETSGTPWSSSTPPDPSDDYARSKWRAEQGLAEIALGGLACVVVRFPLVYGPGVGANFRALLALADTPWWLPFAAIANRRSLLHVDDAAGVLLAAGTHGAAPGHTFVAAHAQPVSTPDLVALLRHHLARPRRLFAMPAGMLEGAAALAGQGGRMRRLTRSLEVDPSELATRLGWAARVPLDEGVRGVVSAFREEGRK